MAQFDVHRSTGGELLIDCQSGLLRHLDTRFVVPLFQPDSAPSRPASRLNPAFDVEGNKWLMFTQLAAAVPTTILGPKLASLADERDQIIAAIDVLFSGV